MSSTTEVAVPERASRPLRMRSTGATSVTIAVGLSIVLALVLAAYVAPLPHSPTTPDADHVLEGPTSEHWFGTDNIGRDVFARVIVAAKTDVPLAIGGTLLSLVIGVVIALTLSVKARWSEWFMRGIDMFQAFPVVILAVAVVSLAGNTLWIVVVAIGLVFTPRFIRLTRSEALTLREARFIEAAAAIGSSTFRILTRHMLPNMTGIILVQAALVASRSLLLIAGLSFLGVGVQPPTASWGSMVQQGAQQIGLGNWWISVFPGLAIFVCVAIFNQVSDALEVMLGRGARG